MGGAEYNLRIVVADAGDGQFDSALMLESFGFRGLEQHRHEVRRQMIAEKHRQDSIHTADSLAAVIRVMREDSIRLAEAYAQLLANQAATADSMAALQHADSLALQLQSVLVIQFRDGSASLEDEHTVLLDALAETLRANPGYKAEIYAKGLPGNPLNLKRVRLISLYLISGNAAPAQLSEPELPKSGSSDELPDDVVEIWVRQN
jgi:ABC-type transporter Mla subunit MlaD